MPQIHSIAPEVGAEGGQDVLVGLEADAFDHQRAVAEQTLDPLLLELLQQVGAVAGHGVHGQPAAAPHSSNVSIKIQINFIRKNNKPLIMEDMNYFMETQMQPNCFKIGDNIHMENSTGVSVLRDHPCKNLDERG